MHGVLQGFGQNSIPHLKKTSYARQIGTYLPGTFHFNAVSRLKTKQKDVDCCIFKLPTLFYCNVMKRTFDDKTTCSYADDIFLTSVPICI